MADGGILRLLFENNSICLASYSSSGLLWPVKTNEKNEKFQVANLSNRLLSSHGGGKYGEA